MGTPLADTLAAYTPDSPQQIDHQSGRRAGWWAERPSLEYQHAFDLCAVEVCREEGEVAVFASSPFYARELLKRFQGKRVRLFPVGNWSSQARDCDGWTGPEVACSSSPMLERNQPWLGAVVWAEPEWERSPELPPWMGQVLLPGSRLYVVASSWLSRFLPEWAQLDERPAQRRTGFLHMWAWLRRAGFVCERLYGFHGPLSALWGYASRWTAQLGRGDWADRCHFQMRVAYIVRGWQSLLAPVVLAVTKRGQ